MLFRSPADAVDRQSYSKMVSLIVCGTIGALHNSNVYHPARVGETATPASTVSRATLPPTSQIIPRKPPSAVTRYMLNDVQSGTSLSRWLCLCCQLTGSAHTAQIGRYCMRSPRTEAATRSLYTRLGLFAVLKVLLSRAWSHLEDHYDLTDRSEERRVGKECPV